MNTISLRCILLSSGALAAAFWPGVASAQVASGDARMSRGASVEELVVTARRREENLQTTPVSITALSSKTLEARNVVTMEQVARIAPNFVARANSGSVGAMAATMRGIQGGDNVIGQDSPIGVYLDGVYAGRITVGMMNLVEPERVEVLRGPQGTLFGRNTTGGAISVITHTPRDEFGGQVKGSYGSYNGRGFQARIDSGLLGDSGVKLSAAYRHDQRGGTHDSGLRPTNLDPGAEKTDAFWFKAMGEWDRFKATLSADYTDTYGVPRTLQIVDATAAVRNMLALSPTLGGGAYNVTRRAQYTIANDTYAGEQHVWSEGVALTLNYEFSDHLEIKSISALRAYKRNDPAAYGPADLRVNVGTVAVPRIASFNGVYGFNARQQSQRQRSQELQVLGTLGDFNYVAGAYYFKEGAWDMGITRLPFALGAGATAIDSITNRLYTVDSKSVAAFGQINWRPSFIDDKLELSGGLRWTKDTRNFNQTQNIARSADLKTKDTSFLLSANYQWTKGAMTFVRYSSGYRAGGFNVRAVATVDPVYLPEKLKSLEVGFKLDLFKDRLRLNGSAFFNRYRDLQVAQFAPPGLTSGGGGVAVNANAKYKGFELEMQAVPVDGLVITASVGYVDPEYTSFPRGLEGGQVVSGCTAIRNSAGVAIAQDCGAIAEFTAFPKTTADLGVAYSFPVKHGELSLRGNYTYSGAQEFGTFNLPSSPFKGSIAAKSYGLLSARIALSEIPLSGNARAQLALFGENLTNEKYVNQGIDFGFMGTIVFGDRRTFGIEGKIEF
jgi:iron complex outermembrane receptor protein